MMTEIIGKVVSPHLHADKPYEFAMPDRIRGSLPELRQHAERVGKGIVRHRDALHDGKTVGSDAAGREWSFRQEGIHERAWDEPAAGIRYVFNGRPSALHRGDIPVGFAGEFKRLAQSAIGSSPITSMRNVCWSLISAGIRSIHACSSTSFFRA
jgi:hypothetical protein